MKKAIIALVVVFLAIGGCSAIAIDKSLSKNVTVDGVYACTTGTYDPAEYGLSPEEFMSRQGVSKTDEPSSKYIYVFATVHSDEKKDLDAPYYQNADTSGAKGTTGPSIEVGGNESGDPTNRVRLSCASLWERKVWKITTRQWLTMAITISALKQPISKISILHRKLQPM